MAEDDFQNNKYPVELMAEKADMTFTRAIGEKTSWNGGEEISLYDGVTQKLYEVSASKEMTAKNNDPLIGTQLRRKRLYLPGIRLRRHC